MSMQLSPEQNSKEDYFKNHNKVKTFPWSLYHKPLEDSLIAAASLVSSGSNTPLQVLVIGCGMLHELSDLPKDIEMTAVDIDQRAVELVASIGDDRIVKTRVMKPEESLSVLEQQYAFIYSKEVIEHMPDPLSHLKQCHAQLKPGGRLWVSTPNYGEPWLPSVEYTVLEVIARLNGFTRFGMHISKFSKRKLKQTLEQAGFADATSQAVSLRLALVGSGTKNL